MPAASSKIAWDTKDRLRNKVVCMEKPTVVELILHAISFLSVVSRGVDTDLNKSKNEGALFIDVRPWTLC